MPKKREQLFVGELVDERRGPGRPTDTPKALSAELRRTAALVAMAQAVIEGASIKRATLSAGNQYHLSADTLTELWKANREAALHEAASELVALRRLSGVDAAESVRAILRQSDERANRRRKPPR